MREDGRPMIGLGFGGCVCLLVGLVLVLSCGQREGEAEAARWETDPMVAALLQERSGLDVAAYRGKPLFQRHCAVCHGEQGEGDGFNAYNLDPPPRHLRVDLARLDDAQIAGVIRDGSISTKGSPLCPPYGRFLSDRDVADIVAYVRTLAEAR